MEGRVLDAAENECDLSREIRISRHSDTLQHPCWVPMYMRQCAQNETTQGHLPRRALGYLLGFFLKPAKPLPGEACADSCVWAMALRCQVFSGMCYRHAEPEFYRTHRSNTRLCTGADISSELRRSLRHDFRDYEPDQAARSYRSR